MPEILHAISVAQPWAWAILFAAKRVENRSWAPPRAIIGRRIALHASKKYDERRTEACAKVLGCSLPPPLHQPTAAIVGSAVIVGAARVIPFDDLDGPRVACGELVGRLDELHAGAVARSPWSSGPWCWVLEDVRAYDSPIPASGRLGIWPLAEQLRDAVAREERLLERLPEDPHVQLAGHALAEKRAAVLWRLEGSGREVWVPTSQILDERPESLTVTRWFAHRERLEGADHA